MMRKYASFYLAGLTLLLLQACMTTPQTPRETIAVSEIGYQEALDTATRWANEGRLSDDDKARLKVAFDNYERTRDAARVAIQSHEIIKGGGSIADLDVANIAALLGLNEQDLRAAQAAGQLVEVLSGQADSKASAVNLSLITLRSVLSEME